MRVVERHDENGWSNWSVGIFGGARPTVVDEKGELWIAKFPQHDENDIGAEKSSIPGRIYADSMCLRHDSKSFPQGAHILSGDLTERSKVHRISNDLIGKDGWRFR